MAKDGHWMEKAFANKGALHRELGVPEGEKIPAKKLARAGKSGDARTRKRVALARTGARYGGRRSGRS